MPQAVTEGTQVNRTTIELIRGDITDLDIQAFVFYAQHDLALGSGFGGAISVRGGPAVQKELDAVGPLQTGDVVVTGAGKMKADFIVHAVGPRFREDDIEGKLSLTMKNTLMRAEEKGFGSLAFPAMGAGYYGIPAPVSARVMLDVLKEHLAGETGIRDVKICVLDTPQFKAFDFWKDRKLLESSREVIEYILKKDNTLDKDFRKLYNYLKGKTARKELQLGGG